MLFRKPKAKEPPPAQPEPEIPPPPEEVIRVLEQLQKAGSQVLVRPGGGEAFTTVVLGLGRDGFFVDTFSPPEGDRFGVPGRLLDFESLIQGVSYTFEARILGKVQYLDELPAFKVAYPTVVRGERRRRSPRVDTVGDASLSFLEPFRCDAPVVNVSEGGCAFEYEAELGRLRPGTRIPEILLELGREPVVTVSARVVGNVVAELGGLTLPRRYRASVSFEPLADEAAEVIRRYLAGRRGLDASA
ncbi:flagellar regulator YcgR PilZN domain-containing protein [Deferrisoma palaeochoriense]